MEGTNGLGTIAVSEQAGYVNVGLINTEYTSAVGMLQWGLFDEAAVYVIDSQAHAEASL